MSAAVKVRAAGHVAAFNRSLQKLVVELGHEYPDDAVMYRARTHVMTAISLSPVQVLDSVGEYLYRFREEILAADGGESFLMQSDADSLVRRAGGADAEGLAQYIIPKAKDHIRRLDAEVKLEYFELVEDMLLQYIEFKTLLVQK
jgi:hypothetical protein